MRFLTTKNLAIVVIAALATVSVFVITEGDKIASLIVGAMGIIGSLADNGGPPPDKEKLKE